MKCLQTFFLSIAIISLTFYSCQTESPKKLELSDFSQQLQDFNQQPLNLGASYQGKAKIYSLSDHSVFIQIQDLKGDMSFVLQREEAAPLPDGEYEQAKVYFFQSFFIFTAPDIDYLLHLGDADIPDNISSQTFTAEIDGFGVGKFNSLPFDQVITSPIVDCQCHKIPPSHITPLNCTAGGIGSTSCGITNKEGESCNSTCGAGYYSCCNDY